MLCDISSFSDIAVACLQFGRIQHGKDWLGPTGAAGRSIEKSFRDTPQSDDSRFFRPVEHLQTHGCGQQQ
jgi:hypothetical protein